MSKFLAKVIKKGTLLSILLAVIVAAATVIGILFGFNPVATVADGKKVTINVEQYIYQADDAKDDIKAACDEAFKNNNVLYVIDADFGGDGEFVYAFKANSELRKNSTSGGAFAALAQGIIKEKGVYHEKENFPFAGDRNGSFGLHDHSFYGDSGCNDSRNC